jgi:V/A-type H+-transporting ATPase subunit K
MKSFSSLIIFGITLITGSGYFLGENAFAQEQQPSAGQASAGSAGMKFIGAGVAFGLAALGAGVAIGGVGAAGLAAITEKPELRSQALVFTALGEAIAIYGIVVAIIILGQS